MNLPIPIFRNEKLYNAVDFDEPDGDVIIKARNAVEKDLYYKAIYEFMAGSIEAMYEQSGEPITDKSRIKRLCLMMPYVSADTIVFQIISMMKGDDDYIEGVYSCPRCGKKIITGNDGMIDTRDRISALPINIMQDYNDSILVELQKAVKIKNAQTGEVLEEIFNFSLRHPVMNDFINAENGQTNELEIQYRAYRNALQEVNNKEIDQKWKSVYGLMVLKKAKATRMSIINEEMKKWGIQAYKERTCMNCEKVWKAPLNIWNFFVSGLQPG